MKTIIINLDQKIKLSDEVIIEISNIIIDITGISGENIRFCNGDEQYQPRVAFKVKDKADVYLEIICNKLTKCKYDWVMKTII